MGIVDSLLVMAAWLEQHGVGRATNAYRLRDWLFSRQRYWGEPFPITYDIEDLSTPLRISDADLPVALPEMTSYQPAGDGEPPLATAPADWLEFTCEETGRRLPTARVADFAWTSARLAAALPQRTALLLPPPSSPLSPHGRRERMREERQ